MKLLFRKLNSKRGASVVLALSFFLVCAVIGGMLLASAASNSGRLANMRQTQEGYYSVSSAAMLVRDCVDEMTFAAYEEVIEGESDVDYTLPSGDLSKWIGDLAKTVYETGKSASEDFEVTAEHMLPVALTLTMDTEYEITADLSLQDEGHRYAMQLVIPATHTSHSYSDVRIIEPEDPEEESTELLVELYTTNVVWNLGQIAKGGGT